MAENVTENGPAVYYVRYIFNGELQSSGFMTEGEAWNEAHSMSERHFFVVAVCDISGGVRRFLP